MRRRRAALSSVEWEVEVIRPGPRNGASQDWKVRAWGPPKSKIMRAPGPGGRRDVLAAEPERPRQRKEQPPLEYRKPRKAPKMTYPKGGERPSYAAVAGGWAEEAAPTRVDLTGEDSTGEEEKVGSGEQNNAGRPAFAFPQPGGSRDWKEELRGVVTELLKAPLGTAAAPRVQQQQQEQCQGNWNGGWNGSWNWGENGGSWGHGEQAWPGNQEQQPQEDADDGEMADPDHNLGEEDGWEPRRNLSSAWHQRRGRWARAGNPWENEGEEEEGGARRRDASRTPPRGRRGKSADSPKND